MGAATVRSEIRFLLNGDEKLSLDDVMKPELRSDPDES